MATQDEASRTGQGVGPQTPAARRRARSARRQHPGVAPTELEEPPAEGAKIQSGAAPESPGSGPDAEPGSEPASQPARPVSEPASGPVAPPEFGPASELGPASTTRPGRGPLGSLDPSRPTPQPAPRRGAASASTRERPAAFLALGSALGVLLSLVGSLASPDTPAVGVGDFGAEASRRVVAPGGLIALTGSDAPDGTPLVLETRVPGRDWREAGRSSAGDDGGFRLGGRVLAPPGRLMLRARAPDVGASAPVAVTVRPLRLASVGDINLGDAPGEAIAANGPRYPWTSVGNALRRADIAFGNLECAISERGEPFPKQFNFRGTPAALAGLRRNSGIDVLNLANNHVGDFGPQATVDTVRAVERLGMRAVGAGPNLRRALAPQVVERLGLRVAFVGFSSIAPLEFAAGDDSPGTAWASPQSITKAVRAARRRADVVVATFHWGIEKATLESAEQRLLAQTAVAAGAQLVIGAHPHVLQPLRRESGALVAYSLGNFVFGAASADTTATGILETDLTAAGIAAARWRAGQIEGGRPLLDSAHLRRLPVRDQDAMAAGIQL
jgi:poly-gamma-glutamate capsule biosynthesis protein CapA/YwtB (metallophosphatase superfamily)